MPVRLADRRITVLLEPVPRDLYANAEELLQELCQKVCGYSALGRSARYRRTEEIEHRRAGDMLLGFFPDDKYTSGSWTKIRRCRKAQRG